MPVLVKHDFLYRPMTVSETYLHLSIQRVKPNLPSIKNGEAGNRPPRVCQVVSTRKHLLSSYFSARAAWAAANLAIGTLKGEQET